MSLARLLALLAPPLRPALFPTRRSSDLLGLHGLQGHRQEARRARLRAPLLPLPRPRLRQAPQVREVPRRLLRRSEEHTSELQSPCNLVCRLLLEQRDRCSQAATAETSSL